MSDIIHPVYPISRDLPDTVVHPGVAPDAPGGGINIVTKGETGGKGNPGEQGEPGEGVLPGGDVGDGLLKATDDDFDTEWGPVETPTGANAKVAAEAVLRTAADALLIPLAQKGAAGGVAPLVGTLIPTVHLPALTITDVFPVGTQAAMLALDAQRGDVAIRSDVPGSFVLAGDDPTTLADWLQLPTPPDAVLSVNGQAGVIVLGFGDVGAAATTDPRLSDARTPLPHDHPINEVTNLQAALDAKAAAIHDHDTRYVLGVISDVEPEHDLFGVPFLWVDSAPELPELWLVEP